MIKPIDTGNVHLNLRLLQNVQLLVQGVCLLLFAQKGGVELSFDFDRFVADGIDVGVDFVLLLLCDHGAVEDMRLEQALDLLVEQSKIVDHMIEFHLHHRRGHVDRFGDECLLVGGDSIDIAQNFEGKLRERLLIAFAHDSRHFHVHPVEYRVARHGGNRLRYLRVHLHQLLAIGANVLDDGHQLVVVRLERLRQLKVFLHLEELALHRLDVLHIVHRDATLHSNY